MPKLRPALLLATFSALSCRDAAPPTANSARVDIAASSTIQPNSATHATKADIPTSRHGAGAAVLDGKLYVFGGMSSANDAQDVVERYDPSTNSWATMAPLPEAAEYASAETLGNRIYVRTHTGGFYRYDPGTNSWTARASDIYQSSGASASNGRYFYFFGGFGTLGVTSRVARYDTVTNTWTTRAPLPVPLNNASAARIGSTIYVVGGYDFAAFAYSATTYAYDISTNSWSTRASPASLARPVLGVIAGKLYSYSGGQDGLYNKVFGYEPGLDTWTVVDEITPAFTDGAGGVIGQELHVVGGYFGGNVTGHYVITPGYSGNHAPVAGIFGGPYSGKEGTPVPMQANASFDADGDELTYFWNFGDGATGTGIAPSHTYADNGTYTVSVAVRDPSGRSSVRVYTGASIGNMPPVIAALSTDTVIRGESFTMPVTVSDPGIGDLFSLKFEFGDGQTPVTEPGPFAPGTSSRDFAMNKGGTYTIRVTARDNGGGIGRADKRVRVFTYVEAINYLRTWVDATLNVADRTDVDRLLTLARDHAAAGHNETAASRLTSFELVTNDLYTQNKIDVTQMQHFNNFANRIVNRLDP